MLNVAVLFGGVSTEHRISCKSAYYIAAALKAGGAKVYLVGITKGGSFLPLHSSLQPELLLSEDWETASLEAHSKFSASTDSRSIAPELFNPKNFFRNLLQVELDVIFPALHGINCEDGNIQGFLELTGLPYVGCNVLASALGMDKVMAKRIFEQSGIPVVPYEAVQRQSLTDPKVLESTCADLIAKLGLPLFIKPAASGSSVGTIRVDEAQALPAALNYVGGFDAKILVEALVDARELECAILGNHEDDLEVAPVGEIIMNADSSYYDYQTKYSPTSTSTVYIPANIPAAVSDEIQALARKAYLALTCRGLSRVDFFLDKKTGAIYLNEINTMPGFTTISLYPKAMQVYGKTYPELVYKLCELAIEAKQQNQRLEVLEGF